MKKREINFSRKCLSYFTFPIFSDEVDGWVWKSVDEKETVSLKGPKELGNQQWKQFISSYDMCLTGTYLPTQGLYIFVKKTFPPLSL